MEENNKKYVNEDAGDEGGIDIMALLRNLWDGRKTVIIFTAIFLVLGLVSALTMKRTYTVNTVMVPQMGGNSKSGLSSLASLAGFDMGMNTSSELTPLAYPQIVSSDPFRLKMLHTPLHYSKCDTAISMYDYAEAKYDKPTVVDVVKQYTIGLPGLLLGKMKSKPAEVVLPTTGADSADGGMKPLVVSQKEFEMMQRMGGIISLAVDKKEGYLTLTVNGSEPIQTAELALKAQQLLQDEVTRFRVEKSQNELEYIQARYEEAKREADRSQEIMAAATDRTQNVPTTRAQIERNRAQSKYNLANSVYMEMAKQLEQAKMQVKKDTPSFAILQPVSVPMKPANSRARTLIVWVFLGFVLGCGIVLVKGYWPQLMEKFKKPDEQPARAE